LGFASVMRIRNCSVVLVGAAIVVMSGCASSQRVAAWGPAPYVHWQNVSPLPVKPLENSYRIVTDQPTQGLFPANIAVTRVGLVPVDDEPGQFVPVVYKDPRNEFLQWNSSFDDQMAISEVFPVDQFDLGGGLAEPDQVVAAFHGLHADLGLIYAMNELAPNQTEIIAALYDVERARPIAYLQASAKSTPPPDESGCRTASDKNHADLWRTDSNALVRKKFEQILYACVYDLIQKDQPELIDVPEGWKRVEPERPAAWPPPQPIEGG